MIDTELMRIIQHAICLTFEGQEADSFGTHHDDGGFSCTGHDMDQWDALTEDATRCVLINLNEAGYVITPPVEKTD